MAFGEAGIAWQFRGLEGRFPPEERQKTNPMAEFRRAAVFIPTYNESENIVDLIQAILTTPTPGVEVEVCVVDDNSPDGTSDLVETLAATDSRVHLIRRTGLKGRGVAGVDGYRWGLARGADLICELDADFSHHPRYLPQLFEAALEADVVLGSRFVDQGLDADRGLVRRMITRAANLYIQIVLGIDVRDPNSGYRCFRRQSLEAIDIESLRSVGPAIVQEVLFRCHRIGLTIHEVGVVFRDRQEGYSKLGFRQLMQGYTTILRLRLFEARKWKRSLKPACPVCHSNQAESYAAEFYQHREQIYDLLRCMGCGLVRVSPLPSPEEVATYYVREYFEADYNSLLARGSYFENEEPLRRRYSEVLDLVRPFRAEPGRFLDVGCAGGYFLKVAREQGWEPTGIELSEEAAVEARKLVDERVIAGRPEDIRDQGERFELIHCGHTLEHMTDPGMFVECARELLVEGGHLAIEVPCYVNSFYFAGVRLLGWLAQENVSHQESRSMLYALKVQRGPRQQPPYHLFEFTPSTLKKLMEKHGLKVVKVYQSVPVPSRPEQGSGWLRRLAQVGFRSLDWLARQGLIRGGQVMVICEKPIE